MDSYTDRDYTCACGTKVHVTHIPVSTSGNATYQVECPKCGQVLATILYTPGDPPRKS